MHILRALVLSAFFIAVAPLRLATCLPSGGNSGSGRPAACTGGSAPSSSTPPAACPPPIWKQTKHFLGVLAQDPVLRGIVATGTGLYLIVDATERAVRRKHAAWARFAREHFGRETIATAQLSLDPAQPATEWQRERLEYAKQQIDAVNSVVDGYLRCFTNTLADEPRGGRRSTTEEASVWDADRMNDALVECAKELKVTDPQSRGVLPRGTRVRVAKKLPPTPPPPVEEQQLFRSAPTAPPRARLAAFRPTLFFKQNQQLQQQQPAPSTDRSTADNVLNAVRSDSVWKHRFNAAATQLQQQPTHSSGGTGAVAPSTGNGRPMRPQSAVFGFGKGR